MADKPIQSDLGFAVLMTHERVKAFQELLVLSDLAEGIVFGLKTNPDYVAKKVMIKELRDSMTDQIHARGWCTDGNCKYNKKVTDVDSTGMFKELKKEDGDVVK